MLRGRFGDSTGRPYMEGRLLIPRLSLEGDVSFLVDTGADSSVINPADAKEIGIDYSKLGNLTPSLGTAGVAENFVEPASLVFTDPGKFLYIYHVDLDVAAPNPNVPDLDELPSLLGREVLDRWRMVYDPTRNQLTFIARSADVIIPLEA